MSDKCECTCRFVWHLLGETPGYYKDCRDFWCNSSVHSVQYMCAIVPMNVTVLYCHFKQVVCGCCLLYIDVKDGTTECDVRTCNAWDRYFGSMLWTAHRFCALVMNCICFFLQFNFSKPSNVLGSSGGGGVSFVDGTNIKHDEVYSHFKQVMCGLFLLYVHVKDGTTECNARTCNA